MSVPQTIRELVERFERNRDAYRSPQYNETQLRREFLDPFFKALGWDIDNEQGYAEAYKDVVHEDAIKVGEATKAPDYCFRIGGARKFFLEAKRPSVDVKHDVGPAFQLRRYGFTTKLPLNILTDFEEFAVYDCRFKPDQHDNAAAGRILYLPYTDYAKRWDEIAGIFSRDAVLKGAFDKFAESTKAKRGTADMDDEFLKTIEGWRDNLARNLAMRNPKLTQRQLNFAVQRIIDRIIFLRICEGRGIEDYGRLQALTNGDRIYPRLAQQFEQADDRYNSGLFHFKKEIGRHEAPDELTLNLDLDDKLLRDILKSLYYPESPYVFSALRADILGQVYEQFLGKVIRLTEGHQAKVEEKPEVKKAGGVYYTPTYIVDYIVQNTVGRLLEECSSRRKEALIENSEILPRGGTKSEIEVSLLTSAATDQGLDARSASRILNRVSKLRILDPACGSGSFLLGAYESLLQWHLDFYVRLLAETAAPHLVTSASEGRGHGEGSGARWLLRRRNPPVVQTGVGWRLTIGERKRILLDNIYGVDIDAQAVETTKLSLLLKVLEGETQQSLQPVLRMFQERALPDLGANIKCGNSLIGPDFYQQSELPLLTDEERYRINVFDWHAEFPHIFRRRDSSGDLHETAAASPLDYTMPGVPLHGSYSYKKKKVEKPALPPAQVEPEWEGGFDAVIGNPPWGASFNDAELEYLRTYFPQVVARMVDSYIYFIARALQLATDSRPIGFIIPSTILNQIDARPVREVLVRHGLAQVISLGQGIFGSKVLNTSTILITGDGGSAHLVLADLSKVRLVERSKALSRRQLVERQQWQKLVEEDPHKTFFTGENSATVLLGRLRREQIALSDILRGGIARGVSPDVVAAHVVSPAAARKLRLEKELLRPSLSGPQIKRYRDWRIDQLIIYTAKATDINSFPRVKQHLLSFRSKNTCREVKEGKHPFWSLHRPRDTEIFRAPKFIGITTSKTIELIYDADQSVFVTDAMYLFSIKDGFDPLAVLAILQSRLFLFLYRVSNQGEARVIPQVKASKLEPLPFPKAIDKSVHTRVLTEKAQEMFRLHRQLALAKTPHEKTGLERQITANDAQIDRLVYELYGLTEEEINIVEGTI